MTAIEIDDNQIDFTRLYFWERDTFNTDQIAFYQYREVVPRKFLGDPIIKFKQMIQKNEFQFGAALRHSGAIDLYWNFTLVQTVTDEIYDDIYINFSEFVLVTARKDATGNKIKKEIKMKWDSRIGIGVSEEIFLPDNVISRVDYKSIAR